MVGGYAAKELVERGLKPGELTILSADTSVPYERPPLSKASLRERYRREYPDKSLGFYSQHGIDVRLQCQVDGIDSGKKALHLKTGEELGFEKLLLATGARVRTLDIPGNKLTGIYYLRSLEDSKRIRLQAESAKQAVVIGGGFIAMEVASVLAQKGIAVTMILQDDRIWKKVFTPSMSRFSRAITPRAGVGFIKLANVAELRGSA